MRMQANVPLIMAGAARALLMRLEEMDGEGEERWRRSVQGCV